MAGKCPQEHSPKRAPRKRRPLLKGGYAADFVDPLPDMVQYQCSICLQILCNPYHLANQNDDRASSGVGACQCGKSFCKTCIDRIYDTTKICPLCLAPFNLIVPNRNLKLTLNDRKVVCKQNDGNNSGGESCKWVGLLKDLEKHLNPSSDKELEGCQYYMLECEFCEKSVCRKSMIDHKRSICPLRPFSCDYCNDYTSNYTDVTVNHSPVCPSSPDAVIKCELEYAGCSATFPRKRLDDHYTSHMTAHVTMIAKHGRSQEEQNALLKKQLDKMSETVSRVEKENFELKGEVSRIRNEHNNTVKELKEEIKSLDKKIVDGGVSLSSDAAEKMKMLNTIFSDEIEAAKVTTALSLEERSSKMEYEVQEELKKLKSSGIKERVRMELGMITRTEKQERQEMNKRIDELSAHVHQLDANTADLLMTQVPRHEQRLKGIEEVHKNLFSKVTSSVLVIEATARQLQEMDKEINVTVPSRCGILPVDIVMTDFSLWQMENREWCSPPFYIAGHKLCLTIYADGDPTKRMSHPSSRGSLSLYVHILKGDMDDEPTCAWPFHGTVIIQFLHPTSPLKHKIKDLPFDGNTPPLYANQLKDRARAKGWGYADFIKHGHLEHYLRGDRNRLHIRINKK